MKLFILLLSLFIMPAQAFQSIQDENYSKFYEVKNLIKYQLEKAAKTYGNTSKTIIDVAAHNRTLLEDIGKFYPITYRVEIDDPGIRNYVKYEDSLGTITWEFLEMFRTEQIDFFSVESEEQKPSDPNSYYNYKTLYKK